MSLLWLKWSCAIWSSLEPDTWKKSIQEKSFLKTEDSEFCFNNAYVETFKQFELNLPLRKTALKFINVIGPLQTEN